ncbi:hypothetical protein KQX54_007172 [Cotesia glomerata]|uniref:Uncharacterized protein n=1 Tax=Cotesia glomerata TaxID=32391 RepID=A0AAV7IVE9_COTGL|nr:hypothetical protein KQX54_007172 [Cotesia glomerata]
MTKSGTLLETEDTLVSGSVERLTSRLVTFGGTIDWNLATSQHQLALTHKGTWPAGRPEFCLALTHSSYRVPLPLLTSSSLVPRFTPLRTALYQDLPLSGAQRRSLSSPPSVSQSLEHNIPTQPGRASLRRVSEGSLVEFETSPP